MWSDFKSSISQLNEKSNYIKALWIFFYSVYCLSSRLGTMTAVIASACWYSNSYNHDGLYKLDDPSMHADSMFCCPGSSRFVGDSCELDETQN